MPDFDKSEQIGRVVLLLIMQEMMFIQMPSLRILLMQLPMITPIMTKSRKKLMKKYLVYFLAQMMIFGQSI
jgi:hypothetical protein